MTYNVTLLERVVKHDLPSIPEANKRQIFRAVSERLTIAPVSLGKPLTGEFKGLYRLRVGDWRIIYDVEPGEVTIHAIKIRRDSYKRW